MNNNILIVAAHPDDEVLGCGALAASMAKNGVGVYALLLGAGLTSRGPAGKTQFAALKKQALAANKILGVKKVFFSNFPDNSFDSVPLLKIVKEIEKIKNIVKPAIILTHHFGDANVDHRQTHNAVLAAARARPGECVKKIYTFEIPSSTEWNCYDRSAAFVPNTFINATAGIKAKIAAMAAYKMELRAYPHPRSLEHIENLAKVNGAKAGMQYAEAFCLLRSTGDL